MLQTFLNSITTILMKNLGNSKTSMLQNIREIRPACTRPYNNIIPMRNTRKKYFKNIKVLLTFSNRHVLKPHMTWFIASLCTCIRAWPRMNRYFWIRISIWTLTDFSTDRSWICWTCPFCLPMWVICVCLVFSWNETGSLTFLLTLLIEDKHSEFQFQFRLGSMMFTTKIMLYGWGWWLWEVAYLWMM